MFLLLSGLGSCLETGFLFGIVIQKNTISIPYAIFKVSGNISWCPPFFVKNNFLMQKISK